MSSSTGERTDPVLADFPIRQRGAYLEKFEPGETFAHHWGRTLSAADNSVFSTALCNWNPMHLDADYARAHGHTDVVVNPMLVLCTVIGLSVEDLSESGGPFLGIEECAFPMPVHPGDTLTATSEVLAVRGSRSRPDTGIVTWRTTGRNQRGETVCSYVRSNLVAKRGPR
ncbi:MULTISPECIES: MaoC family dehydratase [Pseudonocardia]|uniref:Bifunctional protein PaaZ n=2 Tax=Pseudonocardia TaxID=1847 RepID=A0A1Y2MZX5_PSEAH|nr:MULTISPECIES: MaoC family dehydratase [Pseudonocardia]OSY40756.1 Bifunctional protein PaaZ [Pseudonocardia autotrophica]TDN71937.1 acyl dehydratase [Pseudonocardia autotrophica]BBG02624.1 MaoC-like dehydratase [Pseudonocardia autotrophica]GEC24683.1 MaoC-like dehydratase [Pseudonocardia saturnea]